MHQSTYPIKKYLSLITALTFLGQLISPNGTAATVIPEANLAPYVNILPSVAAFEDATKEPFNKKPTFFWKGTAYEQLITETLGTDKKLLFEIHTQLTWKDLPVLIQNRRILERLKNNNKIKIPLTDAQKEALLHWLAFQITYLAPIQMLEEFEAEFKFLPVDKLAQMKNKSAITINAPFQYTITLPHPDSLSLFRPKNEGLMRASFSHLFELVRAYNRDVFDLGHPQHSIDPSKTQTLEHSLANLEKTIFFDDPFIIKPIKSKTPSAPKARPKKILPIDSDGGDVSDVGEQFRTIFAKKEPKTINVSELVIRSITEKQTRTPGYDISRTPQYLRAYYQNFSFINFKVMARPEDRLLGQLSTLWSIIQRFARQRESTDFFASEETIAATMILVDAQFPLAQLDNSEAAVRGIDNFLEMGYAALQMRLNSLKNLKNESESFSWQQYSQLILVIITILESVINHIPLRKSHFDALLDIDIDTILEITDLEALLAKAEKLRSNRGSENTFFKAA